MSRLTRLIKTPLEGAIEGQGVNEIWGVFSYPPFCNRGCPEGWTEVFKTKCDQTPQCNDKGCIDCGNPCWSGEKSVCSLQFPRKINDIVMSFGCSGDYNLPIFNCNTFVNAARGAHIALPMGKQSPNVKCYDQWICGVPVNKKK